ncbi:Na+/H+ antiporter NhaC family protein [Shouchella sp. JSM 1781072]|uniref:Na+/H+ antiporter NhaC family protein n=1 Tax=Shouchella sp. JSM 1781072 TaxID=3344581 RepID=UPI0035C080CB
MIKPNPWALTPFLIFLSLFIGAGIVTGDFYAFPVIVAIVIASAFALAMNRQESFSKKIDHFSKGAGHPNVMLMVLIFLLAGAFSGITNAMGAVDSTVQLALAVVPQDLLAVGLFVIACFISLAMGTSVGTIVALAPIGVGISEITDIPTALIIAAIIGGAMFGDNLSFISDTTITAVRSQGAQMKDKFKVNFWIVLPATIITCILLWTLTSGESAPIEYTSFSWYKIVPYVLVIAFAIAGMNVFIVLTLGIVLAGIIGLVDGSFQLLQLLQSIGEGMEGMYEMAFLAILIAGMMELIRLNGGIEFLLQLVTKRVKSRKSAEFGIAGLVGLTNLSTANNTIAIMIAGPLAKNIANQYEIEPRKSASVLDLFSCTVQGLIPYGAQLLIAAGVAGISPVSIVPYSFYPMLIAICGSVAILIGYPKKKEKSRP